MDMNIVLGSIVIAAYLTQLVSGVWALVRMYQRGRVEFSAVWLTTLGAFAFTTLYANYMWTGS